MATPRFQRRKEARPAEITEAALAAFAENGYAATRVDDVAKRAGVSKGLLYLYFKTKEELFKAVVRSFLSPRIDAVIEKTEQSDLSATDFLRGPFLEFAQFVPKSPAKILIRLMIAEGPKHPDLVAWYWENVVAKGLSALKNVMSRGVKNGEFRQSALNEFPQLLATPVLFSVVWKIIFSAQSDLDTDRFIEAHLESLLTSIMAETK